MKGASFSTYENLLHNHVLPAFGDATSISEETLQAFVLEKLDGGFSLSTVQLMVLIVRMVLRHGATLGLCERPSWSIKYPSQTHHRHFMKVFSLQDQSKMLVAVQTKISARKLGIFIALATGMRIGEICALQWGDIDLAAGVIHVRRSLERIYTPHGDGTRSRLVLGSTKTGSSVRDIPIADDLANQLAKMSKGKRSNDFILTNGPKPTEPRSYRNFFNLFLDELGIPRKNFHALRHSFATRCIEAGFDPKTVSTLLGHSNISTTLDLYVHPSFDKKKACVNSISMTL